MTLALLITAVGGAWAQDVDGTIAWSVGNEASATVSASINDAISSTGVTTGSGLDVSTANYFETNMVKYTPTTANAGNVEGVMIEYTIEAVDGYKFKPTGVDYAAVKVGADSPTYSWSYTIDGVESAITDVSYTSVLRSNGNNSGTAQLMHSESITADGCSVFTLRFYISNCGTTKNICIGNITISGSVSAAPEPDVEVTTNAAEEGATFTEASFEMPTSDVDVDYELVRDMGYKVAFSGVPTRARLAKDGDGKFHFADPLTFQLLDNIDAANPKDITSAEGITFMVGEVEAVDFEGNTFYQLDKETLVPLADFLADAHLGNYAICAVASTGEYDGWVGTPYFTLTEQYELAIAPADDMSKRGVVETVTVGTRTVTLDADGKASTTAQPAEKVTIKAKRGYVIEKVEVEKKAAATTITIGVDPNGHSNAPAKTIEYTAGETWAEVAARYDWLSTYDVYTVYHTDYTPGNLMYVDSINGPTGVKPNDTVDPEKTYIWGD